MPARGGDGLRGQLLVTDLVHQRGRGRHQRIERLLAALLPRRLAPSNGRVADDDESTLIIFAEPEPRLAISTFRGDSMSIRWVDTPRTLTHFREAGADAVADFDNELGLDGEQVVQHVSGAVQHTADRRLQLGLHDAGRADQPSSTKLGKQLELEREPRHRLESVAGSSVRAAAGDRRAARDGAGESRQQSVQGVRAVGSDGHRSGDPIGCGTGTAGRSASSCAVNRAALLVASQLVSCAPSFNAQLYAASQTF